jgi:hypothetical protein
MCRRVECTKCGRPTYAGCGAHIEQVLGDVPRDERCRCRETQEQKGKAEHGETAGRSSWLRRLIG